MTDKQSFLDRLNSALLGRGLKDADIQPYLERFDRFYDRMKNSPDEVNPEVLNDIDTIADNIAAQISERYDEINRFAERTMTINKVPENPPAPIKTEAPADSEVPPVPDTGDYELVAADAPTGVILPVNSPRSDELPTEERQAVHAGQENDDPGHLPDYVEDEPAPNSTMFWVLFCISLPVTIPLALVVVALFVLVWGGLIALIIGSVGVLIAGVALGTALSLVGIIYGITQLFSVVPVGLYEIGIGVVIAGIVMFGGILVYNIAVRFLPFVMKLLGRLFGYLCRKLKTLFNFLRRECAKL